MNARRIHAVLAAGVQNPDRIARWQKDPQSLLRLGVPSGALDLDALRKFSGLTVKVRHNGVRQRLPLTFRLMSFTGLDIEIFAAYGAFMAERQQAFASDPERRTQDLMDFLAQWLRPDRVEHALLWDMARHERALAILGRPEMPPHLGADADAHAHPPSHRPSIRGAVQLHEMQSDPIAIAPLLFEPNPRISEVKLAARFFAYWKPGVDQELQILELDAFGFYLLSFARDARSLSDLSQKLGGSRRPSAAFRRCATRLADVGIFSLGHRTKAPAQ